MSRFSKVEVILDSDDLGEYTVDKSPYDAFLEALNKISPMYRPVWETYEHEVANCAERFFVILERRG